MNKPDSPHTTVTLASGASVPFVEQGAGEPLLFIHGSLCDYRYWAPQWQGLAAHYRCIAPSLSYYWPGEPDAVPYPFGWRHHVDEMAALIDQMEMGPVHVAGHSRGGAVAFQMALRHPRLVRTLTLADPGGALDTGEAARAPLPVSVNALRARAASLIAEGEREAGLELFVDSVSRPGAWQKSPLAFRTMAEQNAHTLALQFADPLPDYSADTARGIRCPVLLIDGEKSPRMFRQNVEMLERWIDGAQRITIAGASHGMNLAHPAAFNRGIRQFVERSASG